jgi:hypothetical protein
MVQIFEYKELDNPVGSSWFCALKVQLLNCFFWWDFKKDNLASEWNLILLNNNNLFSN